MAFQSRKAWAKRLDDAGLVAAIPGAALPLDDTERAKLRKEFVAIKEKEFIANEREQDSEFVRYYLVVDELFFRVFPEISRLLRETPDDRAAIDKQFQLYRDLRSILRPDEKSETK